MNRLEMARQMLEQQPSACPFLGSLDSQTRASLEQQHPNPHQLPEDTLLEIASSHGFVNGEKNAAQMPGFFVGAGFMPDDDTNEAMPTHDWQIPQRAERTHGSPLPIYGDGRDLL